MGYSIIGLSNTSKSFEKEKYPVKFLMPISLGIRPSKAGTNLLNFGSLDLESITVQCDQVSQDLLKTWSVVPVC